MPEEIARFPIMMSNTINAVRAAGSMFVCVSIPWSMIAPHEKQAKLNHYQTIKRLAERGGLSACEALAVLEDHHYKTMDVAESNERLCNLVKTWLSSQEAKEP